jgi:hypothetical protein
VRERVRIMFELERTERELNRSLHRYGAASRRSHGYHALLSEGSDLNSQDKVS